MNGEGGKGGERKLHARKGNSRRLERKEISRWKGREELRWVRRETQEKEESKTRERDEGD